MGGILGGLGLSGAAGLNAYIPLLLVAILGRCGVVHLEAPFDLLTQTWAIAVISVLLAIELVVDKVPGADHLNDIVQTFVRPAAGAVLFGAESGVLSHVHPAVPIVCGLVVAFSVHATKAAARPVVNVATVGFGAPVVSALEDVTSVLASLVALFAPVIVLGFVALFAAAVVLVVTRRRRRTAARAPAPAD